MVTTMALTEAQVVILLLCRLLVVGPVLKWLALFIYLFIYLFLRVHSPDQTVIYY